ncbi:MAG: YmdB family metallophosphoesterase [Treponemataceae bacterium]|nr:YmdB family metallophosphoesterase [Treponemataceae bacterium]
MPGSIRCLFLGDVVGDPGIQGLQQKLPCLKEKWNASLVIANGENAAGGFGLTAYTLECILNAGVDLVTTGNHVWEKRDFWPVLENDPRVIRPANYPPGLPGRGFICVPTVESPIYVLNLQGREDMIPIDCPFRTLDIIIEHIAKETQQSDRRPIIIVDFHAESNQEKEALAFYGNGRISALVGSHTHVQTADERILTPFSEIGENESIPFQQNLFRSTAYITDVGMCGVIGSVIGMDSALCLERNRTQIPYKMELAKGETLLQGVCIEFNTSDGSALFIERFSV